MGTDSEQYRRDERERKALAQIAQVRQQIAELRAQSHTGSTAAKAAFARVHVARPLSQPDRSPGDIAPIRRRHAEAPCGAR